MKTFLSLFLVLTACLTTAWCATESAAPATHPLKGVVMGILPEKTALLVKHEEVPGVMRAMTMMFKVEPAVLEKVKRGDAITARMSRRHDGWWLTEVEVQPPAAPAK
jgi:Cu/Ag efflux protein CusF